MLAVSPLPAAPPRLHTPLFCPMNPIVLDDCQLRHVLWTFSRATRLVHPSSHGCQLGVSNVMHIKGAVFHNILVPARFSRRCRFRDGLPEHVRFLAAQQVLAELEAELASQATPAEVQAGVTSLTTERRRKIGRFFARVAKQKEQVTQLKEKLDDTPDYVPTSAEAEHLQAEQELHALVKEQAIAKAEERFATVLNLQPRIDALRKKESALAPIVRRTRAERANQRKFDLRSNPHDQFVGKVAQRLRAEAEGARRHERSS